MVFQGSVGTMNTPPQLCIEHFVDMLHSYISAERSTLSGICRMDAKKKWCLQKWRIKLFPVAHSLCVCIVWHLGTLLVNLVQHFNLRTVTPLDEVKKSSLCAKVQGWWKDYLESPCAAQEWGDPSHSCMMMEVYDRSQIPLINHQNHCPCPSWKGHCSSDLGIGKG